MSKPVNIGQDLLSGQVPLGFNKVVFAFSKHWNIVFLFYWWIFVLLYELQVYRVGLFNW